MNRPESLFTWLHLQEAVLDYLWVIGKALTVAEIQMGFAGVGGAEIQAALDALIADGLVERRDDPSPLTPLWDSLPRYRAISQEEGRDDA